jgi:hypothetical protein
MGSTSHGMRDRWPFGTPRTRSSRFSIPTHLPHQFLNSKIVTLFRDFVYREFETLGSKNHLSPSRFPEPRNETLDSKSLPSRFPEPRNAVETPLQKYFAFRDFGVFSVKCPDSLSTEMPKRRSPKCRNALQGYFVFRDFGIFNAEGPTPCHQNFWYAEPRNTEISPLAILFAIRVLE